MTLDDETSKKVIRQVEFYFSDSNLPRDHFLKKTINDSDDGLVSLALICSFARMRSHLGLGDVKADEIPGEKLNAIAETLRSSDFLKISDDGKKVGRKSALAKPEEVIEQVDNRTIAASPLPHDVKLEDVESFFAQTAKVNSVRLPRQVSDKRFFCGTALVEFSTEEDAQNVLKKNLVYAGADLTLKTKKDFDAERKKQDEEHLASQADSNAKGSASGGANYPKGLIVAFTLKSTPSGDTLKQSSSDEPANKEVEPSKTNGEETAAVVSEEAGTTVDGNKEKVGDETISVAVSKEAKDGEESVDGTEVETDKPSSDGKSTVGETSSIAENKEVTDGEKSVDGTEVETDKTSSDGKSTAAAGKDKKDVISREDLKAVFEKFGTIKYIDFNIGQDSGYLRFEEAEAGQKARASAVLSEEGGIAVKNCIATLEPVTGEAEKEYWSQIRGGRDRFQGKGNRGRRVKLQRFKQNSFGLGFLLCFFTCIVSGHGILCTVHLS